MSNRERLERMAAAHIGNAPDVSVAIKWALAEIDRLTARVSQLEQFSHELAERIGAASEVLGHLAERKQAAKIIRESLEDAGVDLSTVIIEDDGEAT